MFKESNKISDELGIMEISEKDIKFPEGFKVIKMEKGDYSTIVSEEDLTWGITDLYIVIGIKYHEATCDAIICIGKDVDQLYGEREEVLDRINYHISKFFRETAKEKDLYYKY